MQLQSQPLHILGLSAAVTTFLKFFTRIFQLIMTTLEDLNKKVNTLASLIEKLAALQVTQTENALETQTNKVRPAHFYFPVFSSDSETLEEYLDRFKLQLKLSQIPENQYADYLRVHMGPELSSILTNISYPTKVSTLTFDDISKKLITHLVASKNKYSEAINFRKIVQKSGETIPEYVGRLKAASRYCEFNIFLDYSLTIQFIHGVIRDDIRNAIISEKPESFDDTLKVALAIESARQAASVLKPVSNSNINQFYHESRPKTRKSRSRSRSHSGKSSQSNGHSNSESSSHFRSSSPHKSSSVRKSSPAPSCVGCGGTHHRSSCKYKNAVCHNCNTKGHISTVCRKA